MASTPSGSSSGEDIILAPGISIHWRDIDPSASAPTAAAVATPFETATANNTLAAPETTITAVPRKSGGISGGTIGLAVGATVVALAIVGGTLFYMFWKKKKWVGTEEGEVYGRDGMPPAPSGRRVGDVEEVRVERVEPVGGGGKTTAPRY